MSLTTSVRTFKATFEQAKFMAEYAGLRHEATEHRELVKQDRFSYPFYSSFDMWQDKETGGGRCRICHKEGVVTISRHSEYAYANIVEETAEYFRTILKCEELDHDSQKTEKMELDWLAKKMIANYRSDPLSQNIVVKFYLKNEFIIISNVCTVSLGSWHQQLFKALKENGLSPLYVDSLVVCGESIITTVNFNFSKPVG